MAESMQFHGIADRGPPIGEGNNQEHFKVNSLDFSKLENNANGQNTGSFTICQNEDGAQTFQLNLQVSQSNVQTPNDANSKKSPSACFGIQPNSVGA